MKIYALFCLYQDKRGIMTQESNLFCWLDFILIYYLSDKEIVYIAIYF